MVDHHADTKIEMYSTGQLAATLRVYIAFDTYKNCDVIREFTTATFPVIVCAQCLKDLVKSTRKVY